MEYLDALRRYWVVALVVVAAVVVPTLVANLAQPRQYTATSLQYVGVQGGSSVTDLQQKVSVTGDLMSSYPSLVVSPLVLDKVIAQLGLQTDAATLAGRVSATVPNDTVVLDIKATDPNPARSADIANAVARQFGIVVAGLPQFRAGSTYVVSTTTIQPAVAPKAPSSPDLVRNMGVALALSLVLAVIACLLAARYWGSGSRDQTAPAGRSTPTWG